MHRASIAFLIFTTIIGFNGLKAQETGEDELGAWYMYFGANRVADNYSIHTEAQLRLYNVFGNFNQAMLRVGLNRHLGEKAMVTAGYAFIPTASYDKGDLKVSTSEHRIWEQFILRNKVGRYVFEHRYRLEQRWITVDQTGGQTYLNRVRYRLMVSMPLNKPVMETGTVFLAAYDEVFLNLIDTPFDQNRLYFAVGYQASPALNVQLGYLRHRSGDLGFNRLQAGIGFNPDFR